MEEAAIIDWDNYTQKVYSEFMTRHSVKKIRGTGKIVEVDEFLKKGKI